MATLFLINPGSGRKRNADSIEQTIHRIYQKAEQEVETWQIDFSKLDEKLELAISQGIKHIFAVGGDGTVNAIGTRLIGKDAHFGVIPQGSGNGYARNLGFSIHAKVAIKQSLDAWSMKVDTATFNGVSFLNVAGVGLDAEVAKIFSMGKSRGLAPYVKSSAEGLIGFQARDYEVNIDGEWRAYEQIMGIVVANGTQFGYDAKISPQASITDGLLDIIIVHKFPLIKAGFIVGKLFSGRFQKSKYVELIRGKNLFIRRAIEGPAQIDGESLDAGKEIQIDIQEKNLNILLPNTLTEKAIQSL